MSPIFLLPPPLLLLPLLLHPHPPFPQILPLQTPPSRNTRTTPENEKEKERRVTVQQKETRRAPPRRRERRVCVFGGFGRGFFSACSKGVYGYGA
ncbi:hypothetical protein B0H13DRAFT_2050032, partial [Mycena leptocephala]